MTDYFEIWLKKAFFQTNYSFVSQNVNKKVVNNKWLQVLKMDL